MVFLIRIRQLVIRTPEENISSGAMQGSAGQPL